MTNMIMCRRCQVRTYFEPDNPFQAVCDSCGEEDPEFAYAAILKKVAEQKLAPEQVNSFTDVDAQWCPLTSEEENRFYDQPTKKALPQVWEKYREKDADVSNQYDEDSWFN